MTMNLTGLPFEVLNHVVVDAGILEPADIFNVIRTSSYFYSSFRFALFQRLALGRPTLCFRPDTSEAPPTGSYTFFPGRTYLTGLRLRKFLASVHEGVIGETELGWIRHLAFSPEICRNTLLYNDEFPAATRRGDVHAPEHAQQASSVATTNTQPTLHSVARKMCMDLKNVVSLHIRVLGWPKNPISDLLQHSGPLSQYVAQQRACIGLLYYFPHIQLDLHLETVAEEFLHQVLRHNYIKLLSLNFETVKAEDQRSIELEILNFKDLELLRVKAINPWSEKNMDLDLDQAPVMKTPKLNNDLPKLKKLHLVNSPNFSSLPESIETLEIDIGEFDEISHNCWPTMAMLPNLRKLYMVNNQVTLPRYPHNPYATPVVPVLGFTTLHTIHAEIPRPEQKVFFIPPKVLLSIAQYNPNLRHIFMPCIAKGDVGAIRDSECRESVRSLEVQSDVMRSTMGEMGFETTDLIKLFDHPGGVPKLEILKWACGGRSRMALTPELAQAIMKKTKQGTKKHNLKVLAIENRISKPHGGRNDISSHPTFDEDPFSTIQRLRRSLANGCVSSAGASNQPSSLSCCYNSESKRFHRISGGSAVDQANQQMSSIQADLLACLKPVKLTYPGSEDPETLAPTELMESGMDIEHERLTTAESEYLKRWRRMGGNFMAVTEHKKENNGHILRDTTGIWEDLFFVDIDKLERFVQNWEGRIGAVVAAS